MKLKLTKEKKKIKYVTVSSRLEQDLYEKLLVVCQENKVNRSEAINLILKKVLK